MTSARRQANFWGAVLSLSLLLGACSSYHAKAPAGFAAYSDWSPFRAVSPDGVVYRVHTESNQPKAELTFWKEAMKKRMLDAGYSMQRDQEIKNAQGKDGYLLELSAPVGTEDYSYLVALYPAGKKLVVVEASGEVLRLAKHHDDLLKAIGEVEL